MSEPASLHARISKAFRRRGPRVRGIYVTARRATRFFKDAPRRAALAALPRTDVRIEPNAGFVVVPGGRFDETASIVTEARAALARFDATAPPPGKNRKRFLQNVLDPATLTLGSAIVRFALRDDVLAAVSRYLGVVPFLSTVAVFHSDTTDGDPTSSQLYHCDGDDVTQVKVFVYCTDVDAASGPLTVLDARTTRDVQLRTGYAFRDRLTDEQVRQAVSSVREHAILGPVGTTSFVDTSRCFHFGSRVAPDAPPRLVTMVQYQTPYSFMLPGNAVLPFQRLSSPSLTPLQRLVLG
jgi:hypothetical protein